MVRDKNKKRNIKIEKDGRNENLKFAVSQWIYGGEPVEESMERLAKYRYTGIEIMGEPKKVDVKKTKELLESYELEAPSVAGIWPPERDLINADEKVRRATLQYIKDCVKMIAELGGCVFSGFIPSGVMKMEPMASEGEEWQWAVEGTRKAARYAANFGVKLGIEPINRFETYFINRADQALKLLEDVNMNNVGIVLDNFHLNIEEPSTINAIKKVGKHLINFHVADNNRMPPGQGQSDWKAITATLREIRYDGYLVMEFLPPIDRTPLKRLQYGIREVDESLRGFLTTHGTARMTKEYYDESTNYAIDFLKKLL
ncbi:MAG: TIM barrel protein [Candidatus Heimdallarchaeota archaeon]